MIQAELDAKQASVRRGISHAEMLWANERQASVSSSALPKFGEAKDYIYIKDEPSFFEVFAKADVDNHSVEYFDDYIRFSERLAKIATGDVSATKVLCIVITTLRMEAIWHLCLHRWKTLSLLNVKKFLS